MMALPYVILTLSTAITCWLTASTIPIFITISVLGIFLCCTLGRRVYLYAGAPFFMIMFIVYITQGRVLLSLNYAILTSSLLTQACCLGWMTAVPKQSRSGLATLRVCSLIISLAALAPAALLLLTAYDLLRPGLASLPAFILLITIAMQLDAAPQLDRQAKRTNRNEWLRYATLLSMASLALFVSSPASVALLAGAEHAKFWVLQKLRHAASPQQQTVTGTATGPEGMAVNSSGISPTLELENQYKVDNPHTPIIHLTFTDSELKRVGSRVMRVRTQVYDYFTENTWGMAEYAQKMVTDPDDGKRDKKITHSPPGGAALTCRIYTPVFHGGKLPVVSRLNSIHLPVVMAYPNGVYAPLLSQAHHKYSYDITFTPDTLLDRAASGISLNEGQGINIQLPDDPVIARLKAEILDGINAETGTYESLRALMTYFHQNYRYATENRNPDNLPPLENFLFSEKVGHCELFASAFVIAARAQGIPARLCAGYAGGEIDPNKGLMTFYSDDAHAWAEIQTADGEWRVMDPTPGDSGLSPGPPQPVESLPQLAAADFPTLSSLLSDFELQDSDSLDAQHPFAAFIESAAPWLLPGILGMALIAMLLISTRIRSIKKDRTGVIHARQSTLPKWFAAFCMHYGRLGCRRKNSQTVTEYFEELKKRRYIQSEFDDMAEYLNRISYTGEPRSDMLEAGFKKRIKELQSQKDAA